MAYYHLGCKTGHPQYYLRAHEDFNSINSTDPEVIDVMSLCHGLVLQVSKCLQALCSLLNFDAVCSWPSLRQSYWQHTPAAAMHAARSWGV